MNTTDSPEEYQEDENDVLTNLHDSMYLEELHEGLVIVDPQTTWGIVAVGLLIASIIAWGILGQLPLQIEGNGVFTTSNGFSDNGKEINSDGIVVAYFQVGYLTGIKIGNNADIMLDNISVYTHGVIKGNVTSIEDFNSASKEPKFLRAIITPKHNLQAPSGFEWSSGKAPSIKIASGTPCAVTVTVGEISPVAYFWLYIMLKDGDSTGRSHAIGH